MARRPPYGVEEPWFSRIDRAKLPRGSRRLGDYGLVEKAQNTFEECLVRVPFVVKPPAEFRAKPGVSEAMVELIDLPATVEALAEIQPAPRTSAALSCRSSPERPRCTGMRSSVKGGACPVKLTAWSGRATPISTRRTSTGPV